MSSHPQDEVSATERTYLYEWLVGTRQPKSQELLGAAAEKFGLSRGALPVTSEARAALDGLYARTQTILRQAGVESLTLYRGLENAAGVQDGSWEEGPLSSWTPLREMAASHALSLGGRLISTEVPRERVVGFYGSGMGSAYTQEYVLSGGKFEIRVEKLTERKAHSESPRWRSEAADVTTLEPEWRLAHPGYNIAQGGAAAAMGQALATARHRGGLLTVRDNLGRLAGVLSYLKPGEYPNEHDTYHLAWMGVETDAQGQGAGGELVRALAAVAAAASKALTTSPATPESKAFFVKHGFKYLGWGTSWGGHSERHYQLSAEKVQEITQATQVAKELARGSRYPGEVAGTKPIPEGQVRLYHYTSKAALASIGERGLLQSKSRGALYEEPAVVWGSTRIPKPQSLNFIEFYVAPEKIDVGHPRFSGHPLTQAEIDEFQTGDHDVTIFGDVTPSQIIDIHEPWHEALRYLEANPTYYQQDIVENPGLYKPNRDTRLDPAIAAFKAKYDIQELEVEGIEKEVEL
jgi:GNAT superfamily N-acetyltransferase